MYPKSNNKKYIYNYNIKKKKKKGTVDIDDQVTTPGTLGATAKRQ